MPTTTAPFRSGSRHAIKEFINNWWIWEISASIVSLVLLAALFIVFNHYNNVALDNWQHSWTLNSEVSFMATIIQTAMMVPIVAGISQLKWLWYKENHSLGDIDTFDQASRGPFGAFFLIFSLPFKYLASFGAFLTIATVVFHTLIQQTISIEGGLVQLDTPAYYPRGDNYSLFAEYSSGLTLGNQGPVPNMVASINYAAFYDVMNSDIHYESPNFTCATGNCTWPHIQTLGVCSMCADVSNLITVSGDYYVVSNGLQLDAVSGIVTAAGFTEYPDPSVLPGVGPLIIKFVAMARQSLTSPPVGVDCALYWCVYDYFDIKMVNYINVSAGETQNWTDTTAAQTYYLQENDIVLAPPTCLDDAGEPYQDTSLCIKTVGAYTQAGLQNFFGSSVYGFTGTTSKNSTTGGFNVNSEFMQVLLTTAAYADDIVGAYSQIIENIATEMTVNIAEGNTDYAQGTTSLWITKYHIYWGYMVVPTLLVVLSAVFLSITIVKSTGNEKWKSSSLPLLFHGLKFPPGSPLEDLMDMKGVASNTMVHLEKVDEVSQFV